MANAGISGSDICDMTLEAVETRFGGCRAPQPVEVLSDNGSPYTAKDTRIFARQLRLRPRYRSQKMTLAASTMAERNRSPQRVYRVAMAFQSFRRAKAFSMRQRFLLSRRLWLAGRFRPLRAGIQTRRPRLLSSSRSQSAS